MLKKVLAKLSEYDYEDLAEFLNDRYSVSHPEDDREFIFTTTRNGQDLLLYPIPQYYPSDFLSVSKLFKWDQKYSSFLWEYGLTILEKAAEVTQNADELEAVLLVSWSEYGPNQVLKSCGFTVEFKKSYTPVIECYIF